MRALLNLAAGLAMACASEPVKMIDLGDGVIVRVSVVEDAPTPEHPRAACIAATINDQARVEGKMLPEIVRVIGRTSLEDGHRWMVLRGPNFDPKKWQPWEESAIAFGAHCGPEISAYDVQQSTPPEIGMKH